MDKKKTPLQKYIESKPDLLKSLSNMQLIHNCLKKWQRIREQWKPEGKTWKDFMLINKNKFECPVCMYSFKAGNAASHYESFLKGDFRACQRGMYKMEGIKIPSGIMSKNT